MNPAARSHEFRERIRSLERTLGVLGKGDAACCGVTLAQCHALVEIGRARALSLHALAALLRLDNSTMSRTVEHLVAKALAAREPAPEDRRRVLITLTDKGNRLFAGIEQKMEAYYRKVYEQMPARKRKQVMASLDLLLAALGQTSCCP